MQFIVFGYDGTDELALQRRLAVREKHLMQAKELYNQGKWLYAAALLNEENKMIGSMIVCDFPSRGALEDQWLSGEPYVLGKVWQRIEIHRAQVAPFCTPKV